MAEKCLFKTPGGDRCKAWSLKDAEYCFWHDPGQAEKRKDARTRGARAKALLSRDPEILIGEIVESLPAETKEIITERKLRFPTMKSLQFFMEDQITDIEENKTHSKLSQADRFLILQHGKEIRAIKESEGIDLLWEINHQLDQDKGR